MSIKDSLLFGFTLLDIVVREIRDPGGFVSFSYKNMYGFIPETYNKKNIYSTAYSLRKTGNIATSDAGIFYLSPKGKKAIEMRFPLLRFANSSWDGKWRIIGFDIEEEKRGMRDKLRRSLRNFGFGMIQKSLYFSDLGFELDIQEFLSQNREIFANTYIFVSEAFFVEDRLSFLDKAFKIREVNNRYRDLYYKIEKGSLHEEKEKYMRDFLAISASDPFLPKELLPKNFARDHVWKKIASMV